jgi:ABC-type Fe3+ transport system permease subunit
MTGAIALRCRLVRKVNAARLGWLGWSSVITAALVLAPIAAVVFNVFLPSETTWSHLIATVLPEYIANTVGLVVLVAVGVVLCGVSTAWLVTAYRFPGQRLLEWALVLPLAMPAYVMAYAYTDWPQAAGPVQTMLRDVTGWRVREYWFPEIRSLPGAAACSLLRSIRMFTCWRAPLSWNNRATLWKLLGSRAIATRDAFCGLRCRWREPGSLRALLWR